MSLSNYRNTANRLQQEIATLQKKASQLVKQQANIQTNIQSQIRIDQSSLSKIKIPNIMFSMQQKIANLRN